MMARMFCVASLLTVLLGCGAEPSSTHTVVAEPARAERKVPVEAIRVETQQIRAVVVATGTIAAKQTSNIGPLVEGVIEEVMVRVGDRVKKGDPLFRTRAAIYLRQAAEAEAAVRVAEANLQQANRNYTRSLELEQKRLVSRAERDNAETAVSVARAGVEQARARRGTAQQELADTVVRAPFDGAVTGRTVDEGVFMSNRFSGMGNSSVLQLQELGIVGAIVRAPEAQIASLGIGLPAKLYVAGFDEPFDSAVLILNDLVDPATRTVELRLPILNPDYRVKPGQFVRAEISATPVSALVVPSAAVHGLGDSRHVFVIEGDHVNRRTVSAIDLDGERVQIISGIEQDELVAVSPIALADGDLIIAAEGPRVAG